ncbi:Acg family FMN-binding oxidoreductase [Bacillus sp. J33]|uniref:Acg family FMN-binding oxidoreductase n=1 Tax=Bacillus sp. J33 TaxID=935836 RepID=UPI00055443DE|nr:hypothetical protein [Bacillus sp. J33]
MKKVKKRMGIIIISAIALLLVLFSILLISSGAFMKDRYSEPWMNSYYKRYSDPRVQLAAHGILAPSGHNMQPWQVRLDPDPKIFYLYSDPNKLVPLADPLARQTLISQGTFLEYLQAAGERLGYKLEIELFPEGEYDENDLKTSMKTKPVAKISIQPDKSKENPLYEHLFKPDTNRSPYKDKELTSQEIKTLKEINNEPDLKLEIFQSDSDRKTLGEFAVNGAKIESSLKRINEESANLFRANEYQKNKYRYGYSVEGQGISGMKKHIMQGLITLFPAINSEKTSADLFVKSTQTAVDHTPAYAMIISKDNSRVSQIKAGRLYSRFVLKSHSLGIVVQPPSQVLEEYPEMKEQYEKIHAKYAKDGYTIQMFVRIGSPTSASPLTMRQDVGDILRDR